MKENKIGRRKFLGLFTAAGSLALIPSILWDQVKASSILNKVPDIVLVKSTDYYKAAVEAVNMLGGISKFVRPGSKVGLLINGAFQNKGTITNPDVALAVVKMCYDAGASELIIFRASEKTYWSKAVNYESHVGLLEKVKHSHELQKLTIAKGIILKEVEVAKEITEIDTFINIPVSKQHGGSFITCCLKNMMGIASRNTDVYFHSPEKDKGLTGEEHLAQCIADLNLIRKPDLCIVDSTVYITTNGPFGPGEIRQDDKVMAGTDPVAIDALFAKIFGYERGIVLSTEYAAKHGIGEADLTKVIIEEKCI